MVNKGSEGNKLEAELKHYNEEIKKLSLDKELYKKELEDKHHQLIILLENQKQNLNIIELLNEENQRLQKENQRLQKENNDLTSKLKVIKNITDGY